MPFSPRDVSRWLRDIHHNIGKANEFAAGLDYEAFLRDDLRVYGVTRCLEIISEASRRLPDELKARYPEIEWKQMAGAGNIYRHDYEDVATRNIWETLNDHLPPLRAIVEKEIAEREPNIPLEVKSVPSADSQIEPEPDAQIDP